MLRDAAPGLQAALTNLLAWEWHCRAAVNQ